MPYSVCFLYGDNCLSVFVLLSFNRKDAQLAGKGKETNNANITIYGKFTMLLGIQQSLPFFFISLGDRLVRPYHPRPYVSPLLDKVYYFDDMIFTICHFKNERETGPS